MLQCIADALILVLHSQVAERKIADEPAALDNRQAADLLARHHPCGLGDRRVGRHRDRLAGHVHFGLFEMRVEAVGDDAHHDIAVGDHADEPVVLHQRDRADVEVAHVLGHLGDRSGRGECGHVLGHNLAYLHNNLLKGGARGGSPL